MYQITDRVAAIREIQGYLGAIPGYENVNQNGIYDTKTSDAVKKFKAERGLAAGDGVDRETFDLLFSAYRESVRLQRLRAELSETIDFPLRLGSIGEGVMRLNAMLADVLDYAGVFHSVRRLPIFTGETEGAISAVTRLFNLEKTLEVDELLFLRIMDEHRTLIKAKKHLGDE